MVLVFGGAYNGKLEFVKEKFGISSKEVFFCKDENLEYDKKVICGFHIFTKACILNKINSLDVVRNNMNFLQDKIIICDEINSGIVPIEKNDRAWREETGRAMQLLSKNSSSIFRVFFGIEERLK